MWTANSTFLSRKWNLQFPPNSRCLPIVLYGVTFQKAVVIIFTALTALSITLLYLFFFGSVFVLTSVMKSETYELRNSNSHHFNTFQNKMFYSAFVNIFIIFYCTIFHKPVCDHWLVMRVNYDVNYKIYPNHNQQTLYEKLYLHNIIVRTVHVGCDWKYS